MLIKIVGGGLTGDGLEAELRGEFEVREETFAHGGFAVQVLLPKAPDALIDTEAYETDERLPYWAELWPSARGLARHLLDHPQGDASLAAIELGCGLALPSLALRWLEMDPLATDWYDDALRFARVNAERNGLPPLHTAPLDWRHPPGGTSYDLVIAADVLYEKRNAESLAALLPQIVAPGGRVLLADPGRVYLTEFKNRMYFAGWRIHEVDAREEADPVTHRMSTVRVFELRRTEKEIS